MKINDYSIYGTMGFDGCAWEVQRARSMGYDEDFFKSVLHNSKWLEYTCDFSVGFSTSVEFRIIWDGTKCEVLDFRDGRAIGETILIQDKALTRTQWNKLLEDMQE